MNSPSYSFIRRSRNPRLESPKRFEPTVKGLNDVEITPVYRRTGRG